MWLLVLILYMKRCTALWLFFARIVTFCCYFLTKITSRNDLSNLVRPKPQQTYDHVVHVEQIPLLRCVRCALFTECQWILYGRLRFAESCAPSACQYDGKRTLGGGGGGQDEAIVGWYSQMRGESATTVRSDAEERTFWGARLLHVS